VTTFVAMLRGINVSGRNKVAMADLKQMVSSLGFDNVRTYVQSGNVVCDGAGAPGAVSSALADGIERTFGLAVPVIVRTGPELARVVASNPFEADGHVPSDEPRLYHVTFLAEAPDPADLEALEQATARFRPDTFRAVGSDLYLHIPGGYGETKLTNALFETRLGVGATTRNWKTVSTLAAMAAA
jgi:uncharacterized protein (DUF1697 family)